MVNYNGETHKENSLLFNHQNRVFTYGDALVERLRVVHGKLVFWEDHYFRLMASMRILRMQIPLEFTMEFLEQEIHKIVPEDDSKDAYEIYLHVFRNATAGESPVKAQVSFLIYGNRLETPFFKHSQDNFTVEIFKDFYVNPGLFSSLHRLDQTLEIVAGIFAEDNGYHDCFLVNSNKYVVGTTKGNLFLVANKQIKSPPLVDGAKNGILRKKVIEIFQKWEDFEIEESSISPFELQKADELFIVDELAGVQSISNYRKKEYKFDVARSLVGRINALVRLT